MQAQQATKHPMRRLLSGRRGILAGAAALVGAGLARLTATPAAEASHGPSDAVGALHVDQNNGGAGRTILGANPAGLPAFQVRRSYSGTFINVQDSIQGYCNDSGSAGVRGIAQTTNLDTYGVVGEALSVGNIGVKGRSGSGEGPFPGVTAGVYGTSHDTNGVLGSSTNVSGVFGVAGGVGPGLGRPGGAVGTSVNDYGIFGTSTNYIGVYGQPTNSYGCGGATSKPGFAGLFGYAGVASAAGFLGINGAPGGTAGYFHGAVTVDGPFAVVNGPKNALVAHPDGSHRRMYCQESPEPWFEDFGRAQLQGGKATVRLDPDFAAVSRSDDYDVFPVPKGECKGLYIANQTPASFEVRELQGGTSSIPFSYRLVARRKDDVGRRMEKVDLPKFDLSDPTTQHTPPGQDKQPPR